MFLDKGELAKAISSKNRNSKFAHLKPKCPKDENCQNKEDILNKDNHVDFDIKELPLELAGNLDNNVTATQTASTSPKPMQNVSNATIGQQQAQKINATSPTNAIAANATTSQQPAQNASIMPATAALQNATMVPKPIPVPSKTFILFPPFSYFYIRAKVSNRHAETEVLNT